MILFPFLYLFKSVAFFTLKISLVFIPLCITFVLGNTQYYITNQLGKAAIDISGVENVQEQFGYLSNAKYYSYPANYRSPYPLASNIDGYIEFRPIYQGKGLINNGGSSLENIDNIWNPSSEVKLARGTVVLPSEKSFETTITAMPPEKELEAGTEQDFELIDNLVETVSQAAGTAADSDPADVAAVKSIFTDIIGKVINKIETTFQENVSDKTLKEEFVYRSKITRKAIAEAPNQAILAAILKPYVANLKAFTSKGK